MSFLRKITLSIFIFVMLLGASSFFVKADSDQELVNFLETLITIGVIPSEKADLARTILNSALSDSSTRINRDLSKGSTGSDVKLLQKILNTNPSTIVASSGPGSSGNETTYFGSATEAAVVKFQNFYSFSPTGIVDGVTRAKVNALLSIVTNADVPEAERPSVDLKVNGQDDNVQIGSGGTATILWTSANVTSCVSGTNVIKPTYGTESIIVTSYTQFEITCVGPKGIVSDSVTVSVTNDSQAVVPQNLVVLGSNSDLGSTTIVIITPPSTSTATTTTVKSLHIYVNGQQNYSTTTVSTSSTFGLSWTSTGFTVCKFTSNPVVTNPTDISIPSAAVTVGNAIITTSPDSVGVLTFTMACATGTSAVNTLNQNPVSSLSPSANLMIATSTLNLFTTEKSLSVYVNGVKDYSSTTSPVSTSHVVSWISTGFSNCKATSNPVITTPPDTSVPTTASTTVVTSPNSLGTIIFTVACATGTSAVNTLNQNPVSSLSPSANLMIATSTLNLFTTEKSLSVYVNGVKDYSSTTSPVSTSYQVKWTSTGFSTCKMTTDPVTTNPADVLVPTVSSTTLTISPNVAGTLTITVACATGTSAVNTLNQNPVSSLSSSTNLMLATSTLNLFATSSINGPADVAKIIGYGPVNHWDSIDAASLANQLHTAGLTVSDVELNVNPYTTDRSFAVTMPKLKAYVTAMRAKNIVTDIDIINGKLNDEEGDYICKSLFTDQYYRDILTYINQNIGTSSIILQPVSEWVSGCHDKRDRWIEIFKQNWTGMKSYYVGSHSAPPSSDWFKEYHASSITDYGNSGELVNTDGGNILNAIGQGGDGLAFADTAKLKAYACHVLLDGTKGFIYYGYGHTAIDSGAITALGELKANMPTSCAALDEAALEEECDPGIVVGFSGVVEAVSECIGSASGYQIIVGPGNSTIGTGHFSSTLESVANPSCRDVNPYGTATALALYDHSTNHGLKVGDCIIGTANGNRDAACEETNPPITCQGVSGGNVKGAISDGGLMAAGVIQEIGSGTCDAVEDAAENGDYSGGGDSFGTQTANWATTGALVGCAIGSIVPGAGCIVGGVVGFVVGGIIGLGSDFGLW